MVAPPAVYILFSGLVVQVVFLLLVVLYIFSLHIHMSILDK